MVAADEKEPYFPRHRRRRGPADRGGGTPRVGCRPHTKNTVTLGRLTAASSPQVAPTVAAGAHVFVQFACAQCHGEGGSGGVSPDVPALTGIGKSLTAAS